MDKIIKNIEAGIAAGKAEATQELINCPFCNEGDFDLCGLKFHLEVYCANYVDEELLERLDTKSYRKRNE